MAGDRAVCQGGSMSKHTPTPWVRLYDDRVTTPDDTDGSKSIAHCYSHLHDCEANAARIVHCVNLHDDLVEALQWLLLTCNAEKDVCPWNAPDARAVHIARTAIAKARAA